MTLAISNKRGEKRLPHIAVLGTRGLPAFWGGIERKCEEIYSRLAIDGFTVTVYTRKNYSKYESLSYRGIRLKPIPTIQEKHLEPFIHAFFCTLHACFSDAQILHYYAQGPCLFSWIPRILSPQKKVVFSCCGLDWKRTKWNRWAQSVIKIGEWLSAKITHSRISVSQAIINYYHENYDVGMWYIPNGTAPVIDPQSSSPLARFGLEKGKYFVFIGRLVPEKSVDEVIAAYLLACKKLSGIKLAIVGDTSATDHYVASLKQQAANNSDIVFTSYVYGETLACLYKNALAYVSASHLEGLPNALLEAIAFGTPVIVSDIEPHIEVLHPPGVEPTPALSWVFETGNAKQLADRMINFSKIDERERNFTGHVTKENVCNYYDWDRVARTHASFYRQWESDKKNLDPLRCYAASANEIPMRKKSAKSHYDTIIQEPMEL